MELKPASNISQIDFCLNFNLFSTKFLVVTSVLILLTLSVKRLHGTPSHAILSERSRLQIAISSTTLHDESGACLQIIRQLRDAILEIELTARRRCTRTAITGAWK